MGFLSELKTSVGGGRYMFILRNYTPLSDLESLKHMSFMFILVDGKKISVGYTVQEKNECAL